MHDFTSKAILAALLALACAPSSAAPAEQEGCRVVRRESCVELHAPSFVFRLDTADGLRAQSWENRLTGRTISLGGGPELAVDVGIAGGPQLFVSFRQASRTFAGVVGASRREGAERGRSASGNGTARADHRDRPAASADNWRDATGRRRGMPSRTRSWRDPGRSRGEPVPVRTIAERHGVPARFLVQILLQLKAAGLVTSTRGAAGGYHLVCPPAEVSLGQVMDVIGGSTSAAREPSASAESPAVKVLMRAWQDVADEVGEMLGGITFAELVDRAKKKEKKRGR